jgi:fatty-acyl-CoA synthase
MTEMSPVGTVSILKGSQKHLSGEEQFQVQSKQGRAVYGVDMKIVTGQGEEVAWDGKASGELLVRGPWVIAEYFKGEGGDPLVADAQGHGWFPTGDVASIDADGFMQITDRSKDVIKSGGEWISSIDLENIAIEHPAVAEAAVIGISHPKWDERPVLVVVTKPGQEVSKDDLLRFYDGKIAKWWMPDDVVFVKELPHTATGKLSKLTLRQQLKDYRLDQK